MNLLPDKHVADIGKPRATDESLREASKRNKRLQYAQICAIVNPKIKSLMGRPDFVPIERSRSVRLWARPHLGHHGDASRYAAGELHRDYPGFLPLECWYELRDSQGGPVSSKAGSPRPVYEWGAQRGTATSKTHLGYTLLKSISLLASSLIFRGGENYAEGGTTSNARRVKR